VPLVLPLSHLKAGGQNWSQLHLPHPGHLYGTESREGAENEGRQGCKGLLGKFLERSYFVRKAGCFTLVQSPWVHVNGL
jgi:hypothetical protein